MISQALEFLRKSAVDASFPRVITSPENANIYLLAKADGTYERLSVVPPPRQHFVNDIQSLIHALDGCAALDPGAAVYATAVSGLTTGAKKSIWYDSESVVGLFDDAARFDRVTLSLGLSPQVESLRSLEKGHTFFDQKQMIRFLKHTMSGCLGPTGELLAIIRAVKFTTTQSGEQTRSQGKASIGTQLLAQLTGAGELPDFVSFAVPIFSNPLVPVVQEVICSLDVDEINAKFCLQPVPLAIDQAVANGVAEVGRRLVNQIAASKLDAAAYVVLAGSAE